MSSGDSSGGIGGGSGGRPYAPCDDVNFQTTIRSPKEAILDRLEPDAVLDVTLETDRATIVLLTRNGERAGSIMSGETASLIACLEAGHRFVAQIRSRNGGTVMVHVRPKAAE